METFFKEARYFLGVNNFNQNAGRGQTDKQRKARNGVSRFIKKTGYFYIIISYNYIHSTILLITGSSWVLPGPEAPGCHCQQYPLATNQLMGQGQIKRANKKVKMYMIR